MRRLVLDTNILIAYWKRCRAGRPLTQISASDVQSWAQRLIELEDSNAIVTPVLVEFLCGVTDKTEMKLSRAFLRAFDPIDRGKILDADWREARRFAERVPRSGRSRDFADCLIKAIAQRLRHDVRSFDSGMPR
jgi:predicted nucleic acid-binding protein